MAHEFTTSYLADSRAVLRHYKQLGERAMEQIEDRDFTTMLDPEMNSVALIVKHMAGNMKSRWTDFLTTDGEKPDRDRDHEFVQPPTDRESVMEVWNKGWEHVFSAVDPLTEADLNRKVTIRGEPHSVTQAINRQIAHYAYHVGQIVFLAKHFRSDKWGSLTIPRNRSVT